MSRLTRAWLRRGALARLLWPLSLVYGALAAFDRWLYAIGLRKVQRADVPVIVVGNVVAGGAGKTPVVLAVVRHLRTRGLTVGVVSRGYGRSTSDCREVHADSEPREVGDEPLLIRRATGAPVFVARQRIDAARALRQRYSDTQLIVSDDGLQHHALARGLEICVFDERGTGNGWLLPAGPLREPWPERLRHGVDFVVHTGQAPAFEGFSSKRRLADYAIDGNGNRIALASLKAGSVTAVAAIAEPEAFFKLLRQRGITLQKTIALTDHHDFNDFDFSSLAGQTVLCTEKDAVKLFSRPESAITKLLAVPLEFSPEPAFLSALDARLAQVISQLPSRHGYQTS